jgi:hypothetical protein
MKTAFKTLAKAIATLSKKNSALALFAAAMLMCGAGAALAAPATIGPHSSPNVYTNLVVPATIASGTFSNLTSQPITIVPGKGVGLEWSFTGGGTTDVTSPYATNVVQVASDITGTNFVSLVSVTAKLNGTTTVTGYTNFPPGFIDSGAQIRVSQVGNGDTNTLTVNRVRLTRAQNLLPQ